ncbi:hypothetical protein ACYSNR_16200 [Enterococcus sp. LJL128]|uniref:hypothetical protein n=1 Tax=Enterococcus sp. LJL51 TaxID=3416656 RepID=UPI003CEBDE00
MTLTKLNELEAAYEAADQKLKAFLQKRIQSLIFFGRTIKLYEAKATCFREVVAECERLEKQAKKQSSSS